ncbi:MAG TPA: DUF1080 domain-containing protein [Bryobacteraceae bacterium]|nr:DUF1080 domain-containing protein [Bryobacteraceae bacterium]
MSLTRRSACAALITAALPHADASQSAIIDWTSMFDGKSLAGWKETPFHNRGQVTIADGTIRLGKGRMTGITWAGDFPKSDYELRFEAARLDGKDFFASLVFPVNDTFCSWINGGWDGAVVGLSNLDGNDASENDTSTVRDFTQGRWYAFRLAVTKDRIQGWIDDSEVIDVNIAGRKVELRFDDTDLCTPLGFVSYATTGALRKVDYRRLPADSARKRI